METMTTATTKRILLVDDDPITNLINKKIITLNTPYTVEAFTNANEALDQCKNCLALASEQFPDAIFLDINMPIMDGWEFLDQFEKIPFATRSKCSVLLLTSSIDSEDIEKSKTYKSVCDFISKPLTINKIEMLKSISPAEGF